MTRVFRALFWAVCAWAVAAMWLSPHLPQVDLPQHAGQVALLRDLVLGHSPWGDDVRLNPFTPYLIGYVPLLALSLVMSIEHAIALVYSLTFAAFVAACIGLRRELRADERLDWLFLPGFFGLAWQWGFLTFLSAVPIGVAFLTMSYRFAGAPTPGRALAVVGLGLAMLFAHGLVFLYAVPIGLLIALHQAASTRPVRWHLFAPGVALLAGFALYKVGVLDREMALAPKSDIVMWGELRNRVRALLIHSTTYQLKAFLAAPLVSLLLFAAPWLLGLRPQPGWRARIPFLWTLGMILVYPAYVSGATNFYDRFAVLLFPTYAVMFGGAVRGAPRAGRLQPAWVVALLAAASALVCARETVRNLAFAAETRDIDALLARMPPNRKVLYVPLDPASPATGLGFAYLHYPLWYQARHGGLVEFNFATLLPQVVRFRDFRRHIGPDASWRPEERMHWSRFDGDGFAEVIVRSARPPDPALLASARCPLQPVDLSGRWRRYRNTCLP
jgi:hypothetical protein